MGASHEFKLASGHERTWAVSKILPDSFPWGTLSSFPQFYCFLCPLSALPLPCPSFLPNKALSLPLIFTDTLPDAMGGTEVYASFPSEAQWGVQFGSLTWTRKDSEFTCPSRNRPLTPLIQYFIPSLSSSLQHTYWVQNHIIRWVDEPTPSQVSKLRTMEQCGSLIEKWGEG